MKGSIGIVGLGEMGGAIAARLRAVGADLRVHDQRSELADEWGDHWSATLRELVERSRLLLIVVATEDQVLDVANEAASHLRAGTTVLVHATVGPDTIEHARKSVSAAGCVLLDAGMSRGAGRMRDGSLTLFVGGEADDLDAVREDLALYSDHIAYVGTSGSGMIAKLCNNLTLHGNRMVLLEAARIAAAYRVDTEALVTGIRASTGGSWAADHWGRVDLAALASGAGETPMVSRTRRELALVLAAANARHVEVPAAALTSRRLPRILESGMAATDRALLLRHKADRVDEWRSARDRAGAYYWSPLLVLTTTGARTGRPRSCVLEFMRRRTEVYVFGSNGGRPQDPDWVVNVRAHPVVTVEIGSHTVSGTALVLPLEEARRVYDERASTRESFVEYSAQAGGRAIPVVRLALAAELPELLEVAEE